MREYEGQYFASVHKGNFWRARGDQPLLIRARLRTLRRLGEGSVILDIGLGEGHFLRRAEVSGFSIFGLDLLREGVDNARSASGSRRLVQADATKLPIADGRLDIVTLWDVVEHISDTDSLLREARRVLRPRGVIALSTPNPDALSVVRRGGDSIQFQDPTHINIRTRSEWLAALEAAGFARLRAGGDAWWNPPYSTWRVVNAGARVTSQAMFALRATWPIRTAENTVIFARASER